MLGRKRNIRWFALSFRHLRKQSLKSNNISIHISGIVVSFSMIVVQLILNLKEFSNFNAEIYCLIILSIQHLSLTTWQLIEVKLKFLMITIHFSLQLLNIIIYLLENSNQSIYLVEHVFYLHSYIRSQVPYCFVVEDVLWTVTGVCYFFATSRFESPPLGVPPEGVSPFSFFW